MEEEKPIEQQLQGCQAKVNEYLNNWKRAAADFINYKKEEVERMVMLGNYAKESMFLNIVSVIDSIYLLQQHTNKLEFVSLSEGVSQIEKQIQEFLKKEGIEAIETEGQKFNPETMEIVEEVEGGEPGMVAEELQKGYKIGEKVLRPAKVKVSK